MEAEHEYQIPEPENVSEEETEFCLDKLTHSELIDFILTEKIQSINKSMERIERFVYTGHYTRSALHCEFGSAVANLDFLANYFSLSLDKIITATRQDNA